MGIEIFVVAANDFDNRFRVRRSVRLFGGRRPEISVGIFGQGDRLLNHLVGNQTKSGLITLINVPLGRGTNCGHRNRISRCLGLADLGNRGGRSGTQVENLLEILTQTAEEGGKEGQDDRPGESVEFGVHNNIMLNITNLFNLLIKIYILSRVRPF